MANRVMRLSIAAGAIAILTVSPSTRADDRSHPLVDGARLSVEKAPWYNQSYKRIGYPNGDPGWDIGACVDVVVRAFREIDIDLQERVARDIAARPKAYGLRRPDRNIDHRRCTNLKVYFSKNGIVLPTASSSAKDSWQPGDIVIWDIHGGRSPNHIGIVSDKRGKSGNYKVIHHYKPKDGFTGRPSEDDVLFRWPLVAHFRWR
jgi:hypothetical protein